MGFYVDCPWFGLHLTRADSPRRPHTPWHRFDWTDDFGGYGRTGPFETSFTNNARKARAMREAGEEDEAENRGAVLEVGNLTLAWGRPLI